MKKLLGAIVGLSLYSVVLLNTSCSNDNGWSLSAVVQNAGDSIFYIEEPSGPVWVLVDSIKADKNGEFSYRASEPYSYGTGIFRLRMGDKAVYFPIEGNESLTLAAKAEDMDKVHRLSGSVAAEGFNRLDSLVNSAIQRVGAKEAAADTILIRQISDVILSDTTCIVSYYAIMHPVENKPLFIFDNSLSIGLLGAAANRYAIYRPDDDKGHELIDMHKKAKQSRRGATSSKGGARMQASVSGRPVVNFVRTDVNGKDRDLNAILDRGGVTVVNMTRYDGPRSAANTAALGEVYQKYKDSGLEIYQISFDPVEATWRQSAHNMPWISVYNKPTDSADILVAYNANPVEGESVSFVFNRNGELVARVVNPADLASAVAKVM